MVINLNFCVTAIRDVQGRRAKRTLGVVPARTSLSTLLLSLNFNRKLHVSAGVKRDVRSPWSRSRRRLLMQDKRVLRLSQLIVVAASLSECPADSERLGAGAESRWINGETPVF